MKAEMFNHQVWVNETDADYLIHTIEKLLERAGFGVEDKIIKTFEPYGFTGLWLLSESHLAIHTFPEEGKAYIELSSCVLDPFELYVLLFPREFKDYKETLILGGGGEK